MGTSLFAGIMRLPMAVHTNSVGEIDWLQRQTGHLVTLISAPHVDLRITLVALLAAFALGALHALGPGHGKTLVGVYLIGSRATPRHAAFLGLTVTLTHTLGVFALGLATLFASQFFVAERMLSILSLLSGLIVLGMGIVLLAKRWRSARVAFASEPLIFATEMEPASGHSLILMSPDAAGVAHSHGGPAHSHDHGGGMHSHLPPGAAGEAVSWRSLLALGVSGGMVPCPSALVLLLAAVALNKTAYGMLLVSAFSLGLALTLVAVGLAFLYARSRFRVRSPSARWPMLLPVASAGFITLLGLILCLTALSGSA